MRALRHKWWCFDAGTVHQGFICRHEMFEWTHRITPETYRNTVLYCIKQRRRCFGYGQHHISYNKALCNSSRRPNIVRESFAYFQLAGRVQERLLNLAFMTNRQTTSPYLTTPKSVPMLAVGLLEFRDCSRFPLKRLRTRDVTSTLSSR